MFMQSDGGLAEARHFRGKDAILSGPAGGIVGMARMSELAGFDKVIGFDMGGTSTDVSHYAGELRAGLPRDRGRGAAAGADARHPHRRGRRRLDPALRRQPLPGRPGLGRRRPRPGLLPPRRPAHGHRRERDARPDPARPLPRRLRRRRRRAAGRRGGPGALHRAGRRDRRPATTAPRSRWPRASCGSRWRTWPTRSARSPSRRATTSPRYVLTTFGGAGGQHACAVADSLGIRDRAGPADGRRAVRARHRAGRHRRHRASSPSSRSSSPRRMDRLTEVADELADAGPRRTAGRGRAGRTGSRSAARVHLRYDGTDTAVAVALDRDRRDADGVRGRPPAAVLLPDGPPADRRGDRGRGGRPDRHQPGRPRDVDPSTTDAARARATVPMYTAGAWARGTAATAASSCRPAITVDRPGDHHRGERHHRGRRRAGPPRTTPYGHLLLERVRGAARATTRPAPRPTRCCWRSSTTCSCRSPSRWAPRLESTAQSVNIKERLDFSCALFDADGNLIANAPHIPVHLGSMGASVQEVIRRNAGRMRPGDVYAVQRPVPRRHPPARRHRGHPGVRRQPARTVLVLRRLPRPPRRDRRAHPGFDAGGQPRRSTRRACCSTTGCWSRTAGSARPRPARAADRRAPYPSRDPETNLADLRAQVAANEKGVEEVGAMIGHFGLDVVQAYMRHVQDNAEESVRRVIDSLDDGEYAYEMDSGAVIQVRITVDRRGPRGDARLHRHLAAARPPTSTRPSSVVTAAVLYVFRTLVADDIPLNDGCLRPLHIVIPAGHDARRPTYPAAVVAGNVETSQAVTGALYARARGAGRGIGDDEQRHLRQRAAASTTRRSRSGSGAGRRLRRRGRRADAHDQLPADRPRGAGVAASRSVLDEFAIRHRQRRRRAAGAAATARYAGSGSPSR